jgi:hypothetical protein
VFDLSTTDLGNYIFHVRLFLPTTVAATVRADISRDFLGVVHEGKQKTNFSWRFSVEVLS